MLLSLLFVLLVHLSLRLRQSLCLHLSLCDCSHRLTTLNVVPRVYVARVVRAQCAVCAVVSAVCVPQSHSAVVAQKTNRAQSQSQCVLAVWRAGCVRVRVCHCHCDYGCVYCVRGQR